MMKLNYYALIAATLLISVPCTALPSEVRQNVLLITIDDLRPALGCYGDQIAVTPNIDQLASQSILFQRAYCQQAVCSPSRLSLLTGRRPDSIKVWDLATHFRTAAADIVTLPQHFKNHGYKTQSIGKIFHGSGAPHAIHRLGRFHLSSIMFVILNCVTQLLQTCKAKGSSELLVKQPAC